MTTLTHPILIETAHGDLDGVPADFIVNLETYPAEPCTWGARRGWETEVRSCTLESVKLGSHCMPREALEAWIGTDALDAIENTVAAYFTDHPQEAA